MSGIASILVHHCYIPGPKSCLRAGGRPRKRGLSPPFTRHEGPAYRKFRRKNGIFFAEEIATKKQFSLHTRDRSQADLELRAYNDKAMGPAFNRQIGMVYLANAQEGLATRTWQEAMDHYRQREMRQSSQDRVARAFQSKAFDPIRRLCLNQTPPKDFLAVVIGPKRQSALHYARRLYNHAIDMGWLLSPFMNKSVWPKGKRTHARAITAAEQERIVGAEAKTRSGAPITNCSG